MRKLQHILFLAGTLLLLAACSNTDNNPNPQGDELKIEGEIQGIQWVLQNEDMPTASLKSTYSKMVFEIDASDQYTWKWYKKGETQPSTFSGDVAYEKTNHTHLSGSGIWNIRINVSHIDGYPVTGAWYGIYAYENETKLLLNVEPEVQNWGDHPTADKGIGSGKQGMEGVFAFDRED